MINCDYSYIVTILLILLAVAAGLLMYALCVASSRADEMIDGMYKEMILHTNNKDNHSHWGEEKREIELMRYEKHGVKY